MSNANEPVLDEVTAAVFTQMFNDAHNNNNYQVELLEQRLREEQMRNCLIVERIEELISGDYPPSTHAIAHALYPAKALIEIKLKEEVTATP